MDRRCLYGHRVAASFRFAIERDACPVCGAELISLEGYRLARKLAEAVPLDAVAAFRTARVVERSYGLTPLDAAVATPATPPAAAPIKAAPAALAASPGAGHAGAKLRASSPPRPSPPPRALMPEVPAGTEVLLDEEELADSGAPATTLVAAVDEEPTLATASAVEAADEPLGTDAPFSAEEDAFFSTTA